MFKLKCHVMPRHTKFSRQKLVAVVWFESLQDSTSPSQTNSKRRRECLRCAIEIREVGIVQLKQRNTKKPKWPAMIKEVKGLLQVVGEDFRPCLVDDYLRTCEDQARVMNTPFLFGVTGQDKWIMKIWRSQITSEACEMTCPKLSSAANFWLLRSAIEYYQILFFQQPLQISAQAPASKLNSIHLEWMKILWIPGYEAQNT